MKLLTFSMNACYICRCIVFFPESVLRQPCVSFHNFSEKIIVSNEVGFKEQEKAQHERPFISRLVRIGVQNAKFSRERTNEKFIRALKVKNPKKRTRDNEWLVKEMCSD